MDDNDTLQNGAHKIAAKMYGEGAAVPVGSILLILTTVLPLILRCFGQGFSSSAVAQHVKDMGPFERLRLRRACMEEARDRKEGRQLYRATLEAVEASTLDELQAFCLAADRQGAAAGYVPGDDD